MMSIRKVGAGQYELTFLIANNKAKGLNEISKKIHVPELNQSQQFSFESVGAIPVEAKQQIVFRFKADDTWASAHILIMELILELKQREIWLSSDSVIDQMKQLSDAFPDIWNRLLQPGANYSSYFEKYLVPQILAIEADQSLLAQQKKNRTKSISLAPLKIFKVLSGPNHQLPFSRFGLYPYQWTDRVRIYLSELDQKFNPDEDIGSKSVIVRSRPPPNPFEEASSKFLPGLSRPITYAQTPVPEKTATQANPMHSSVRMGKSMNPFEMESARKLPGANPFDDSVAPALAQQPAFFAGGPQPQSPLRNPGNWSKQPNPASQTPAIAPNHSVQQPKPMQPPNVAKPIQNTQQSRILPNSQIGREPPKPVDNFNPFEGTTVVHPSNEQLGFFMSSVAPNKQSQAFGDHQESRMAHSAINRQPRVENLPPMLHQAELGQDMALSIVTAPSHTSSMHESLVIGSGSMLDSGMMNYQPNPQPAATKQPPTRAPVQQVEFERAVQVLDSRSGQNTDQTNFLELKPAEFFTKLQLKAEPPKQLCQQVYLHLCRCSIHGRKDSRLPLGQSVWFLLAAKLFKTYPDKFKEFCEFYRDPKQESDSARKEFADVMVAFVERTDPIYALENYENLKIPFEMLHMVDTHMKEHLRYKIISSLENLITKHRELSPPELNIRLAIKGWSIPFFKEQDLNAFPKLVDQLASSDFCLLLEVANQILQELLKGELQHKLDLFATRILRRVLLVTRWQTTESFVEEIGKQDQPYLEVLCKIMATCEGIKKAGAPFKEFRKKFHDLVADASDWFVGHKIQIKQLFTIKVSDDSLIKSLVALNNAISFRSQKQRYESELRTELEYCWNQKTTLTKIKASLDKLVPFFNKQKFSLKKSEWTPLITELEATELFVIEDLLAKPEFLELLERASGLLDIPFMQARLEKRILNSKAQSFNVINRTFEEFVEDFATNECSDLTQEFQNLADSPEEFTDKWSEDLRTSKSTFEELYKIAHQNPAKKMSKTQPKQSAASFKESWFRYLCQYFRKRSAEVNRVIDQFQDFFPNISLDHWLEGLENLTPEYLKDPRSQSEATCAFLLNQLDNMKDLLKGLEIARLIFKNCSKGSADSKKALEDANNMLINMLVDGDLAFFSITESEIRTIKQLLGMLLHYNSTNTGKPTIMRLIQEMLVALSGWKQAGKINSTERLSFPLPDGTHLAGLYFYTWDPQGTGLHHQVTQLLQSLGNSITKIKRCVEAFTESGQANEKNRAKQILEGSYIIFKLDKAQGEYKIFCTHHADEKTNCLENDVTMDLLRGKNQALLEFDRLEDIRIKLTISAMDENESGALSSLKVPFLELIRLVKEVQHELTQIYLSGSIYDLNSCLRQSIHGPQESMGDLQIEERDFSVSVYTKLDAVQEEMLTKITSAKDLNLFKPLTVLLGSLTRMSSDSLINSMVRSQTRENHPTSSRLRLHLSNQQKRFFCHFLINNIESPKAGAQLQEDREIWNSLMKFAGRSKYKSLLDYKFDGLSKDDLLIHFRSDTIIDIMAHRFAGEPSIRSETRSTELKSLPLYGVFRESSLEATFAFLAKRPYLDYEKCLKPRYFLALNNQLTTFDLETFLQRAFTDTAADRFYFMTDYHMMNLDKRHHLLDCLRRYRSGQFCPQGTNTNLLILLPDEDREKVWQEISSASDAVTDTPKSELVAENLKTPEEKKRFADMVNRLRVTVVDSEHGGMGKTYYIESQAQNKNLVTLLVSGECSKAALDSRLEIVQAALNRTTNKHSNMQLDEEPPKKEIVLHIKLDMMENMANNLELVNQFLTQVIVFKFVPYKSGFLDLECINHTYLEIGNSFRYLINQKLPMVKIQPQSSRKTLTKLPLQQWGVSMALNTTESQDRANSRRKLQQEVRVPAGDFEGLDALSLFAMFWTGFKNEDLQKFTMRELMQHPEKKRQYSAIPDSTAFECLSEFLTDPTMGTEQVSSMSQVQAILKIVLYQLCCFEDLHGLHPEVFETSRQPRPGLFQRNDPLIRLEQAGRQSRQYLLRFIFMNSKTFACSASSSLQIEKDKALEIERKTRNTYLNFQSEKDKIDKECDNLMREYKKLVESLPVWSKDERTKLAVFMTNGSFGIVYRDFKDVSADLKTIVELSEHRKMIDINATPNNGDGPAAREKELLLVTGLIRNLDLISLFISRKVFEGQEEKPSQDVEQLSRIFLLKKSREFKGKGYVITSDNYLKIMMIAQRAQVGLPVVIMGATGCGKTYMIEFIARILLQDEFYCVNMHPGVTEADLLLHMESIIRAANQTTSKRVWVLFDEFNTSSLQNLLQEIICARKCSFSRKLGVIPQNIVFVAACNPYRIEPNTSQAGLILEQSKSTLAHRVHPIPDTLLNLVWDFGQLDQETEAQYIYSILDSFKLSRNLPEFQTAEGRSPIGNELMQNPHERTVQPVVFENKRTLAEEEKQSIATCISTCQAFIREKESKNSVSLRDVNRFLRLYEYCMRDFPIGNDYRQALVFAMYLCYFLRIDSAALREELSNILVTKLRTFNMTNINEQFKKISDRFIDDVKSLDVVPADVALNNPVRENLLASYVAIRLKIPLLICGKPGTSKTLSVGICQKIFAADEALKSKSVFFKNCPNFINIHFWGSQNTTCQSITDIFAKAEAHAERFKNAIVGIVFDEVGLAEISDDNPLKVLHPLLEPQENKIAFIGLSNWRLDLSKMNRVLFVSRPDPQIQDLNMINKRLGNVDPILELGLNSLVETFKHFRELQEKELAHLHPNFHGSRDIYNATTQLMNMFDMLSIEKEELKGHTEFDIKIKSAATQKEVEADFHFKLRLLEFCLSVVVQRNFSGIRFGTVSSSQVFTEALTKNLQNSLNDIRQGQTQYDSWMYNQFKDNNKDFTQQYKFAATDLIFQNLKDENSRHLMILTDDELVEDVLIEHIRGFCHEIQKKPLEKVAVFRGAESKKQEFEIISALPKMITTGYTVILKDLDSIYGCLYDLLNQRYEERNGSKGCYLIYDSHKQWIRIHEEFKCVVLMAREDQISKSSGFYKKQQPPFLNRFEKYLVLTDDIASTREKDIIETFQKELYDKEWKTDSLLIHNFSKQLLLSLVYDRKQVLRHAAQTKNGRLSGILANTFKDFVAYHREVVKPMTSTTLTSHKDMLMSSMLNPNTQRGQRIDFEGERSKYMKKMCSLYSKNMILEKLLDTETNPSSTREDFETFRGNFILSHESDSLADILEKISNPFAESKNVAVFTLSPRTMLEQYLKNYENVLLIKAADLKKENSQYNITALLQTARATKDNGNNLDTLVVQFGRRSEWRILAEIREQLVLLSKESKPWNVVVVVHNSVDELRVKKQLYCYIDFSNADWDMTVVDDLESSGYIEFFENLQMSINALLNPNANLIVSDLFANSKRTDILKKAVKKGICNELKTILTTQFKCTPHHSSTTNILSVLEASDNLLTELLEYIMRFAKEEEFETKVVDLVRKRSSKQMQPVLDCQIYINSLVIEHLREAIRQGLTDINETVGFAFLDVVSVLPGEDDSGERRLVLDKRWRIAIQQNLEPEMDLSGELDEFGTKNDRNSGLDPFNNSVEQINGDPVQWYENIVKDFNYIMVTESLTTAVDEIRALIDKNISTNKPAEAGRKAVITKIKNIIATKSDEDLEFQFLMMQEPSLLKYEAILAASLCVKYLYATQEKPTNIFSNFTWKLVYKIMENFNDLISGYSFRRLCLLAIMFGLVHETELKKFNFATTSSVLNPDEIFNQAVRSYERSGYLQVDYTINFQMDIVSMLKETAAFKSKEKELRQAIIKESHTQNTFSEGLSRGEEKKRKEKANLSLISKELMLKFLLIIERQKDNVLQRIEPHKELLAQLNSQDPLSSITAITECLADFFEAFTDNNTKTTAKQILISIQQIFEESAAPERESEFAELAQHVLMIIFRLGKEGMNYLTLMLLDMTKKFGIPLNVDDYNSQIAGELADIQEFGEKAFMKQETFPFPYRVFLKTLKSFTKKYLAEIKQIASKNRLVKTYTVNTEDVVNGWRSIVRNFVERRVTSQQSSPAGSKDQDSGSATISKTPWWPDSEILQEAFERLQRHLDEYLSGQVPPIDLSVVGDILLLQRVTQTAIQDPNAAKVLDALVAKVCKGNLDSVLLGILVRTVYIKKSRNPQLLAGSGLTATAQYIKQQSEGSTSYYSSYFAIVEFGDTVDQLRECMQQLVALSRGEQILDFAITFDQQEGYPTKFWEKYLIFFQIATSNSFRRIMVSGSNSVVERYLKAYTYHNKLLEFYVHITTTDLDIEKQLFVAQTFLYLEAISQEYRDNWTERLNFCRTLHEWIKQGTQKLRSVDMQLAAALEALFEYTMNLLGKLYGSTETRNSVHLDSNLQAVQQLRSEDAKWELRLLLLYFAREVYNTRHSESQLVRVNTLMESMPDIMQLMVKSIKENLSKDRKMARDLADKNLKVLNLAGSQISDFLSAVDPEQSVLVMKDEKNSIRDLIFALGYSKGSKQELQPRLEKCFQSLEQSSKNKTGYLAVKTYLSQKPKLASAVRLLLQLSRISGMITAKSVDELTTEQFAAESKAEKTPVWIETIKCLDTWLKESGAQVSSCLKAIEPDLQQIYLTKTGNSLAAIYEQELNMLKTSDPKLPLRLLVTGPKLKDDKRDSFLMDLVATIIDLITQTADCFERPCTLKCYPYFDKNDLPTLEELEAPESLLAEWYLVEPPAVRLSDEPTTFFDDDYLCEVVRKRLFSKISCLRLQHPFYSYANLKLDRVAVQVKELEAKLRLLGYGAKTTLESGGSRELRRNNDSPRKNLVSTGDNSLKPTLPSDMRLEFVRTMEPISKMYRTMNEPEQLEATHTIESAFAEMTQEISRMNPIDAERPISEILRPKKEKYGENAPASLAFLSKWKVYDLPTIYHARVAISYDLSDQISFNPDARAQELADEFEKASQSCPEVTNDLLRYLILDLKIKTFAIFQMQGLLPKGVSLKELLLEPFSVHLIDMLLKKAGKSYETYSYKLTQVPSILNALNQCIRPKQ